MCFVKKERFKHKYLKSKLVHGCMEAGVAVIGPRSAALTLDPYWTNFSFPASSRGTKGGCFSLGIDSWGPQTDNFPQRDNFWGGSGSNPNSSRNTWLAVSTMSYRLNFILVSYLSWLAKTNLSQPPWLGLYVWIGGYKKTELNWLQSAFYLTQICIWQQRSGAAMS